jgi:hypothetical protein
LLDFLETILIATPGLTNGQLITQSGRGAAASRQRHATCQHRGA